MKVLTPVVNNPVFLRLQVAALKRHLKQPYEFIVFNDAKDFADATNFGDPTMRRQIEETCKELCIPCIPVLNQDHRQIHSPSHRHAATLRHMMTYMRNNPDAYLMLDSDMFPVADIPVEKYQAAKAGAYVYQHRGPVKYAWPNLFYLDTRQAPHLSLLSWDVAPHCDSGGASQLWLSLQAPQDLYAIPHLVSCQWSAEDLPRGLKIATALQAFLGSDVRNVGGRYWCEIYDEVFLHYRAGSNWNGEGKDVHDAMTRRLEEALLD
jgi:hypothetical protein